MSERYVTPCELPSPYERELLTILIEECAEVQQRATKLLRFGRDEVQPGQPELNGVRLGGEIGDLLTMVRLVGEANLVPAVAIQAGKGRKAKQLERFMQTAKATTPVS